MACINSDGTLTIVAGALVRALAETGEPDSLAAATGLPLYRVRGGLREMVQAGIVESTGGRYVLTARGRELLRKAATSA